ncbi:hypothetical protein BDR04DRAFT_620549 [Suillus decipiens]|nr:hypothetical protein BDR04DRAFT_620549 [Suillus decipiens]
MKYDDARERILNTEVDLHLLRMIKERIFDGTIGREGMDILEEIFKNEHLRPIMLQPDNEPSLCNGSWNFDGKNAPKRLFKKATNYVLDKTIRRLVRKPTDYSDKPEYPRNVIGILRKMLETTQLDSVQKSAINYLRIIADYEDAREKMIGAGIIEPLLWCLKVPSLDNQALKDILEKIARHKTLRGEITQNSKILAEMLSSNYPVEIIRMRETFKSLSSYGEIREKVREMGEYQNLKKDTLHYLDPHHHPHQNDLYTSASEAIESIIKAYDTTNEPLLFLFLFLVSIGAYYYPLLAIT